MLKKAAKSIIRSPFIGIPVVKLLRSCGARSTAVRVGRLCKFDPQSVIVNLGANASKRNQFSMHIREGSDQGIKTIWYHGWESFERPMPRVFECLARHGGVGLDIGANSGFYSMLMAASSPRTKVFAFEPFPIARCVLEDNISRNHLNDQIMVLPYALSDTCSEKLLYIPRPHGAVLETSASLNADFRLEHDQEIRVKSLTLDSFVESNAQLKTVDFMKVDVEGHEKEVLLGGIETLRKYRPYFSLEILNDTLATEVTSILQLLDYRFFHLFADRLVESSEVETNPESKNVFFAPTEKIDSLKEKLAHGKLPVLSR
jgi:FkbM family methyltransferase